ncbi:hypothetical protein QVD17_32917 [Tagetes erecta]|uniref:Uncharacterized protein n=1 Tax=Tagetes erecta TaxID=13708 RepID=A0AAD8K0D8_TARER|nr:hypothetical protein QVD17_32917 [Tagetes erecta]
MLCKNLQGVHNRTDYQSFTQPTVIAGEKGGAILIIESYQLPHSLTNNIHIYISSHSLHRSPFLLPTLASTQLIHSTRERYEGDHQHTHRSSRNSSR